MLNHKIYASKCDLHISEAAVKSVMKNSLFRVSMEFYN